MNVLNDLKVWHKAMDIAVETYKLFSNFPKEEKYGLTSQIRRSAVSVPSNIAEGTEEIQKVNLKISLVLQMVRPMSFILN